MWILIVEDEVKMVFYLWKGLMEVSYMVDVVENGKDGLFFVLYEDFDLVVFDVMLLEFDGFEVFRWLCVQKQMFVLLFMVCDVIEDKVVGFEFGVDDYLFKLFVYVEFFVCICLLLWCVLCNVCDILYVVDLEIDLFKCCVWCVDVCIDLIVQEFVLL